MSDDEKRFILPMTDTVGYAVFTPATLGPPKKRVTIRASFTYTVEVPADWGAAMVEFWANDSSSCSNNCVADLTKIVGRLEYTKGGACFCDRTHVEYLRESTAEDLAAEGLDERGRERKPRPVILATSPEHLPAVEAMQAEIDTILERAGRLEDAKAASALPPTRRCK